MKQVNITIEGVVYPIKFGFGANRILAEKWNLKTLGEVGNKLAKTFKFKKNAEPTIDQFIALGDFILAGIVNATPDASIDSDDVVTAIMMDVNSISEIIELYGKSLPKPPPAPKNVKRG